MLISALNDYYDILVKQGKAMPEGYSDIGISYMISLSPMGEINAIIDIRNKVESGRAVKFVPKTVRMPKRLETTTIKANTAEHRPAYIFGLSYDKKSGSFIDNEDKKFLAFKETNLTAIEGLNSPVINAFRRFLQTWEPCKQTENPFLREISKDYAASYYIFCLDMDETVLLHEDAQIVEKQLRSATAALNDPDSVLAQCAVTGKTEPVSRIHNKIKSVRGGQASGTVLVSFKNDSENSYGKTQSFNSNISEQVMLRYTESLNYLLSAPNHHTVIDDTTVIYWACSGNESCCDLLNMLLFENENKITDADLDAILKDCANGVLTENSLKDVLSDLDTDFYIVGIKPNASRLSVKFIYRQKFGKLMINIARFQTEIKINRNAKPVPIWRIKKELISPKSKEETVSPALLDRFFGAIINGTPYPMELLYTVIRRIKTDSDEENKPYIKMNDIRVGLIKACLTRTYHNQKEEFQLALDKNNRNQAYLCGRLFAVLEQIQQKASGYSLNRTIRDAYFSSAVSRPASVFPKILKLTQTHLSKIDNPKYFTGDIREITDHLENEFPLTLSLAEQGKFIIGYYQQMSDHFEKIEQYKEDQHNGN